jgi:hypothetical protein
MLRTQSGLWPTRCQGGGHGHGELDLDHMAT